MHIAKLYVAIFPRESNLKLLHSFRWGRIKQLHLVGHNSLPFDFNTQYMKNYHFDLCNVAKSIGQRDTCLTMSERVHLLLPKGSFTSIDVFYLVNSDIVSCVAVC